MTRLLAAILLLGLATPAAAEPGISEITGTGPADRDFADLAPFGAAIGDRRIVVLGEPSHGDGAVFDMMTRLVEYLHEQKGFDTFIIESGLYDTSVIETRAEAGESLAEMAPGNVFYMYSKSAEGQRLFRYLDAERKAGRPLAFAGMDSQHSGALAVGHLVPDLKSMLAERGSPLAGDAEWPAYEKTAASLLKLDHGPWWTGGFSARAAKIETELCAAQADDFTFPRSPGWWCRIATSVRAQLGSGHDAARDAEMGENLHWLLEHPYKGRKAIVWAHSFHGNRHTSSLVPSGFRTMGAVMDGYYGASLYVVNFTVAGGEYLDFGDFSTHKVPDVAPGSVEEHLARLSPRPQFLDVATAGAAGHLPKRSYLYAYPPSDADWGADGLFYLVAARPAAMPK